MRRFAFLLMALPLLAAAENWQGTIVDVHCKGMDPAIHLRACALHNARQGLGLATSEGKFLQFDKKGSAKALAAINATKQEQLTAEIEGTLKGDTLQVHSLRIVEAASSKASAAMGEHCPMMTGADHAAHDMDCCPKTAAPKQ
jgi:hypothetical protein